MKPTITLCKGIILVIGILLQQKALAQAPEKISYQAVIRNNNDQLIVNSSIGMQISILEGSPEGTAVYIERHFPTTNKNGLISIEIGGGTVISGNLATIDWAEGTYFLKTETDLNGGANYTVTGTSQLLSVPYALYAEIAGNSNVILTDTSASNELQMLSISNDTIFLEKGGYIVLPDTFSYALNADIANSFKKLIPKGDEVCDASNEGGMRYNLLKKKVEYCDGSNWIVLKDVDSTIIPTLSTVVVSSITSNAAVSGGNITNDGGYPVIERGVCWNTSQYPTILNNKTSDGTGKGVYISNIENLQPSAIYFVRAYATNIKGTAYGDQIYFITDDIDETFTDIRDGNIYNVIKIGDQIWMAENLAYLPSVNNPIFTETNPSYNVYGYSGTNVNVSEAKATNNYKTYGVLYNWPAAMNGEAASSSNPSGVQGVCPSGWHLPSDAEWKQLEMYLGLSATEADAINFRGTDQGTKMKSINGWNNGGNGTNESGFTALPSGYFDTEQFNNVGYSGFWWSATNDPDNYYLIWTHWLHYLYTGVARETAGKASGHSVRCVKD